jgi:ribosome recycling factor
MAAAIDHLQHELAGVRTGRANPGLLESLPVDHLGERRPLKALAAVTVRNAQVLAVSVFDPDDAAAVVKAIRDSPLALHAAAEGGELLVRLPRLTSEAVEKLVKLVHQEAEAAHVSVRRARARALDALKKAYGAGAGSADERKRHEKGVQRLHDKYVAEVDRHRKAKDDELRAHKD